MSERDISEEGEDGFDDGGSLLAEALSNGQSVQICRKSPKGGKPRMSIMGFFGIEEDSADEVVTAEPAALQNMRRVARANREKQQLLQAGEGGTDAAAKRRPQRSMRRASTFDATNSEAARQRAALSPSRTTTTTTRGLSPTRTSTKPVLAPPAPPPPALGRARSQASEPRNSDAAAKAQAYAEHEETIKRLTVQDNDIELLLEDPDAFGRLQKVLRKHGAVTNEVLRQVLPLYVKHQLEAKRKKQEEEQKCMDRTAAAVTLHVVREE